MLEIQHITKTFPGVKALEDVSLHFQAGKVTALIGENGAGKSTLMKILSGVYTAYEGQVIWKGKEVRWKNTHDANKNGVAIIHQELNLIPGLSITENIFLGREWVNSLGVLSADSMRAKVKELLQQLKLDVDPDMLVGDLRVGQQQIVEIAKALLMDSDIIFMDEPTSAISDSEVVLLFSIIDELRNAGKAIVYISHKLDELFKIADQFVVLRDGKLISSGDMKSVHPDALIKLMSGRNIDQQKRNASISTETVLNVSGICDHKILKDIAFNVKKGEIIGIFGLMGSGRTELLECLIGLHQYSGMIMLNGQEQRIKNPADALAAGLVLVPEDRKIDGLILGLSVRENISLTTLRDREAFGLIDTRTEKKFVQQYINELGIKTPSAEQPVELLSGGNQQKVVLSKSMAVKPKVLMLDEPTRGIDVHAKSEIYKLIFSLADEGISVIVVSSELPEILTVSNRVIVMCEGNITADMSIESATPELILAAAFPQGITH